MAYRATAIALSNTLGLKQSGAGQISVFRCYPPGGEHWMQSRQPRPEKGTCMTRDEARELRAALDKLLEQW